MNRMHDSRAAALYMPHFSQWTVISFTACPFFTPQLCCNVSLVPAKQIVHKPLIGSSKEVKCSFSNSSSFTITACLCYMGNTVWSSEKAIVFLYSGLRAWWRPYEIVVNGNPVLKVLIGCFRTAIFCNSYELLSCQTVKVPPAICHKHYEWIAKPKKRKQN